MQCFKKRASEWAPVGSEMQLQLQQDGSLVLRDVGGGRGWQLPVGWPGPKMQLLDNVGRGGVGFEGPGQAGI